MIVIIAQQQHDVHCIRYVEYVNCVGVKPRALKLLIDSIIDTLTHIFKRDRSRRFNLCETLVGLI